MFPIVFFYFEWNVFCLEHFIIHSSKLHQLVFVQWFHLVFHNLSAFHMHRVSLRNKYFSAFHVFTRLILLLNLSSMFVPVFPVNWLHPFCPFALFYIIPIDLNIFIRIIWPSTSFAQHWSIWNFISWFPTPVTFYTIVIFAMATIFCHKQTLTFHFHLWHTE